MSYTLNIPDHLYKMLKEAADASGLTPVEWIASRLPPVPSEAGISAEPPAGSLTLADLSRSRICWRAESATFAVAARGDYPSGAARNSPIIWPPNGGRAIDDSLRYRAVGSALPR